jgi:hypothetical protein
VQGRRPGPACEECRPCCPSRSGTQSTRQTRCSARSWRTREDGSGTGRSGQARGIQRRSSGHRRGRTSRCPSCARTSVLPVLFKSPCDHSALERRQGTLDCLWLSMRRHNVSHAPS